MNGLLIYKGVRIVKNREELTLGDKVRILDGRDLKDRELLLFPVGTVGEIVELNTRASSYDFRVEARGHCNRWWYSRSQVAPVEEEYNG